MWKEGVSVFSLYLAFLPPVFSIIHFSHYISDSQISNLDKYQSFFSYAVNLPNTLISVYATENVASRFQEQKKNCDLQTLELKLPWFPWLSKSFGELFPVFASSPCKEQWTLYHSDSVFDEEAWTFIPVNVFFSVLSLWLPL